MSVSGWAGAVYGGLLVVGGAVGLIVALWSAFSLGAPDPVEAAVRATGAIEPAELLRAWHDDSRAGDGSSGCALTDRAIVRVEGGRAVTRVGLAGAAVRVVPRPLAVEVAGVLCPFEPAEGAEWFAGLARAEAARAGRTSWRPVDPRVPR